MQFVDMQARLSHSMVRNLLDLMLGWKFNKILWMQNRYQHNFKLMGFPFLHVERGVPLNNQHIWSIKNFMILGFNLARNKEYKEYAMIQ